MPAIMMEAPSPIVVGIYRAGLKSLSSDKFLFFALSLNKPYRIISISWELQPELGLQEGLCIEISMAQSGGKKLDPILSHSQSSLREMSSCARSRSFSHHDDDDNLYSTSNIERNRTNRWHQHLIQQRICRT